MQQTRNFKRFLALSCVGLAALIAGNCSHFKNGTTTHGDSAPRPGQTGSMAKNVILFIGDGMGISTITAGRIFDGQSKGMLGEEHMLAFEDFNHLALIKTYNANAQVPDSAGTATAIMSGYKANIGAINVRPGTQFEGCGTNSAVPTLADIVSKSQKSVGVVTTTQITHATPAALYGHADDRDWEADRNLPADAQAAGCTSLAAQLVSPDTPINLAFGGGTRTFSDDQIKQWGAQGDDHIVIKSQSELTGLKPSDGQDILGLFSRHHMSYEADRDPTQQPSLADMTRFAIDNLSARDDKGYVLMIEAGRVDHAHHSTNAYRALTDMQALNEAVQVAIEKAGDDTLILVTADHSHSFTMSGYATRGNPILGLLHHADDPRKEPRKGLPDLAKDGKPYTTLGYYNGFNARSADSPTLTEQQVQAPDFRQQVAIPLSSTTHAGEDVPLYAHGPGAHKVRGVMDQDEIQGVILQALGIN